MAKLRGMGSLSKKQELALAIHLEYYGSELCREAYQLVNELNKMFDLGKLDREEHAEIYLFTRRLEHQVGYAEAVVRENADQESE